MCSPFKAFDVVPVFLHSLQISLLHVALNPELSSVLPTWQCYCSWWFLSLPLPGSKDCLQSLLTLTYIHSFILAELFIKLKFLIQTPWDSGKFLTAFPSSDVIFLIRHCLPLIYDSLQKSHLKYELRVWIHVNRTKAQISICSQILECSCRFRNLHSQNVLWVGREGKKRCINIYFF